MPRKTYRKKKRNYNTRYRSSAVMPYKGPLQQTLKTTMTYSDLYVMTSGGITTSSYIWSLNGAYDPDSTGVGHQPRGFDQLMALYDHYVVIGTRVELAFSNPHPTYGAVCIANIRDSSTPEYNPIDLMENPNRKVKVLGVLDSGDSVGRLSFNINPNKFLGRSKPLSDPDLKGTTAANPSEGAYLHFGHIASDRATATAITVEATIVYTMVLIEPKNPAQS